MNGASGPRAAIRRYNVAGFALFAGLFGGFGGWAAFTDIAGAVIAPGTVVVESNVKKVQHSTGGIVGEILVNEGDRVQAGQVLIRLNKTLPQASLGIVVSERDELSARQARLLAERDGAAEIAFPREMDRKGSDASAAAAMAGEIKLFRSRGAALDGEKAQLREQISQINEEIKGYSAQLAAKEQELQFIGNELAGVEDLYKKKLVTVVRYNQLQRDKARLTGERGEIISGIARAKAKVSESEVKILQADRTFHTGVLKDLRDIEGRLSEVREKVVVAGDQYDRIELRAPQSGTVHQLAVHTIGAVINHGETVMEIVPTADQLVVESKVAPHDIDQVELGAPVNVRVMAGNQRTTPEIEGIVERKAADLTIDQMTKNSSYMIRIALNAKNRGQFGDLKLLPGMPAEAFIRTQDRTPLQYLLKPLRDQITRAFRER